MVKRTFRDGQYYRHVRFGKRTVKEGECAAVWLYNGTRKVVEGPQRIRLFFSHVRFLDRHVADANQYLAVQYRDGRKEHRRGPSATFMDPCIHISIQTYDAFKLSANEVLIVYRELQAEQQTAQPLVKGEPMAMAAATNGKAAAAKAATTTTKAAGKSPDKEVAVAACGVPGSVQRRLVCGPAVFIPAANEWIHEFSWHGSVSERTGKGSKTGSPGDEKVPHALQFSKLRCMPDQMYVSVKGVRTTDDAQITVHLMIFYELKRVEQMLDATNDPIGDFINATSADVMTFGASNTYESLLQKTTQLSEVEAFPILASRMQQTGFELLKIVYRGYSASDTLQSMHDQAIAKRTKLKLDADTRAMEQQQMHLDLQCKQERSKAEMDLEAAQHRHKAELKDMEAQQARTGRDADELQAQRHLAERERLALEAKRARNDEDLRYDEALKALGVDLTQLLCVTNQREPDHHIKVEGGAASQLHLEMPARKSLWGGSK